MKQRDPMRAWVWSSLALQAAGWVFDVLWHGVLSPGVEPRTVPDMVRHLATVHLPLYLGAASVLAATGTLLARRASGKAPVVAFIGALLSAGAEAWHAYEHLQLDTHSGPIAGTLSFIGFLIVLGAMWRDRRRQRQAADAIAGRRAA